MKTEPDSFEIPDSMIGSRKPEGGFIHALIPSINQNRAVSLEKQFISGLIKADVHFLFPRRLFNGERTLILQ